jgi:response regulator RpfG family c-di-GMP phosphodiesterase
LLHDVGKIGVRDSILLKPGKLNEDEWVEMRKHPQIGYNILQSSNFFLLLQKLFCAIRSDGTDWDIRADWPEWIFRLAPGYLLS